MEYTHYYPLYNRSFAIESYNSYIDRKRGVLRNKKKKVIPVNNNRMAAIRNSKMNQTIKNLP